jgi:diguanylate cyclase (GGDEF)-like protein/putative nucleotidyltransferase with HDIG domain
MSQQGRDSAYPPGLRRLIVSVFALAIPVAAWSGARIVLHPPDLDKALQVALFLGLAFLADLKPVPLDEDGGRSVSLAFVFILAGQILFGWQYAVVIAAVSILVPQALERRPPLRTLFNVAVYALSAFASAIPALAVGADAGRSAVSVTIFSFVGGAAFVAVNVVFVCSAVALFQRIPLRPLVVDNIRHGGSAFVTMAFLAALAATLWLTGPPLLVLMAGPLLTLTLYQHSALASRIATRDAHTDSLTLLGNHRAYELALAESLAQADEDGTHVSLCLVDVDDFKAVNDTYGHPLGDEVLRELTRRFAAGDPDVRAFRFGGDEFALLFDCNIEEAYRRVESIHRLVSETPFPHGEPLTISVGVGSFPQHAPTGEELQRVADGALYWAKHHGKNRSCVYSPTLVRLYSPAEVERQAERQARLRAAENLVRVVDARDTYTGRHSESVSLLAEAVARELGLAPDVVEQVRLAGLLHDLGKIAISDQVLKKPTALTAEEVQLVRTHPELGASLLDGLEIDPVDAWIRHHHEHWDGSGYPSALAGEAIPLGSRIILVADAFDAITSDRSYRAAVSIEEALAELRRMSGRQFDPRVIYALESLLAGLEEDDRRLLSHGEPALIRLSA